MRFWQISAPFRRQKRNRLRRIMRGYRKLKKAGQLGRIMELKKDLTNTKLVQNGNGVPEPWFGRSAGNLEHATRQFLLARLANLELNKALLQASGTPGAAVVYPLPNEWRLALANRGFPVANFRSSMCWAGFVVRLLAKGLVTMTLQFLDSVRCVIRSSDYPIASYAYFDSLSAGNLPQVCRDGRSDDIITWYEHWRGRSRNIDALRHSVHGAAACFVGGKRVEFMSNPVPALRTVRALARFGFWSFRVGAVALLDLARGRWWRAVMLSETALAVVARFQDPGLLASEYLFHNSGWIYRPLWTYEAEAKGSRITFYFYSTNVEPIKRSKRDVPLTYGYEAMSWPHYLVWDDYQADFVRRAVGEDAAISVVGQIRFQTSAEEVPDINGSVISVFDVSPCRTSFYVTLGISSEFYVPEVALRFLSDILEVARAYNCQIVWKRKRQDSAIVHARYRRFSRFFAQSKSVVVVDPGASATRVIEQSQLVVSIPFTSTALIAREFGKPSCYYDPLSLLQQDDDAAHGIPIVQGPQALVAWVQSNAHGKTAFRRRPVAAQLAK